METESAFVVFTKSLFIIFVMYLVIGFALGLGMWFAWKVTHWNWLNPDGLYKWIEKSVNKMKKNEDNYFEGSEPTPTPTKEVKPQE